MSTIEQIAPGAEQETPPRKPPAPDGWHKLFRESGSVLVQDLNASSEFVEAQKRSIHSEASMKMTEPPNWLRRLIEKKAGVEEIVDTAVKRAIRIGTENALQEVYAVLNDVGRDPKGSAEIRKHLTPENLTQLLRKE